MTWRRWKLGVAVSLFLSLLVAGAGLTEGMSWRVFVAVFCMASITHFGSFLKDHPPESIEETNTEDEKCTCRRT